VLAGTIRVENHDSKKYTVELDCSGNHKSFTIDSSTTASYTFDSTEKSCKITGGDVKFSASKLVDGQHWKIDNGKATPN
jgi:hypothetical protein